MLSTILISVTLVAVIFVLANKYTKKKEQPSVPTVDDEPLGYETSSLAVVVERENIYKEIIDQLESNIAVAESVEKASKPKAKKKMSAKPKAKTKAPKKKKDA